MRQINIDIQNVAGPMSRFYQFCVGGGRAYDTLVAENQRHLKMVHDDCGFQYVRFHGLPLDFISTHTYGVDGFVDEFGTQALEMCPDEKSITKDVKRVAEAVRNSKMPDLPVYFTEWSSSYSPRDPVHDSYHQASFLLTRLKDS